MAEQARWWLGAVLLGGLGFTLYAARTGHPAWAGLTFSLLVLVATSLAWLALRAESARTYRLRGRRHIRRRRPPIRYCPTCSAFTEHRYLGGSLTAVACLNCAARRHETTRES